MKIVNIFILIAAVLGLTSCMDNSCVPPYFTDFNWDAYNEAWRIYMDTEFECSDAKVHEYNGKSIKVCGWLVKENSTITITSDPLFNNGRYFGLLINCTPEIQAAIDTCNLTKKCYLKGSVGIVKFADGKGDYCCKMGMRSIALQSMNDIYFEEE